MGITSIESLECPHCGKPATVTLNLIKPAYKGAPTKADVIEFQCPEHCTIANEVILAYLRLE